MKRWLLFLLRYIPIFVAFAIGMLLLQVIALPKLVQRAALSKLDEAGLDEFTMEIRSCSWRSAELTNIKLGKQQCGSIGAVTVNYSLRSLLKGQFKTIQIIGGQLFLSVQNGTLELQNAGNQPFGIQKSSSSPPPFDALEFCACSLSIQWEQQTLMIPFAGSLSKSSDHQMDGTINLILQGIPIPLQITSDFEKKTVAVAVEKEAFDLRSFMGAIPRDALDLPENLTGKLNIRMKGSASLDGGLNTFMLIAENTQTNLAETAVRYGKISAHTVHFSIQKKGDDFTLSGSATGNGWQLKKLSGIVPAECLKQNKKKPAEFSWAFETAIPESIAQKISSLNPDISQLGTLQIDGRLVTACSPPADQRIPDFEIPEMQWVLTPGNLKIQQPDATLRDLSGKIRVQGRCDSGKIQFSLLPGSHFQLGSADSGTVSLGEARFNLQSMPDQTAIEADLNQPTQKIQLHLAANSERMTLQCEDQELPLNIRDARLAIDASLEPGAVTATGTLALAELQCRSEDAGIRLKIDDLVLNTRLKPVTDSDSVLSATLSANQATVFQANTNELITLTRDILQPVSFTYRTDRRQGRLALRWPLQTNASLSLNGQLNLRGKQPAGFLSVRCNGFHIHPDQPAVHFLADTTGLLVSGNLSLKGGVQLKQGRLIPKLTLTTDSGTIASSRFQAAAEGIHGSLTFSGIAPLSTPGNQQFKIDRLTLGKLQLKDGTIAFRLEKDPQAIFIEHANWEGLGGRIYSQSLRITPNRPRINIRLFANGLEMGQVLGLALGDGVAGQGSLYGMIPVSISRTNPTDFILDEGFLYSTTKTGSWSIENNGINNNIQKTLQQQMENMFQGTVDISTKNKIFEGLRNFEYSMFNIDFIRKNDGILARIITRGKSRNYAVPVDFEQIIFDFPGIDDTLQKIMVIQNAIKQCPPTEK